MRKPYTTTEHVGCQTPNPNGDDSWRTLNPKRCSSSRRTSIRSGSFRHSHGTPVMAVVVVVLVVVVVAVIVVVVVFFVTRLAHRRQHCED